MKIRFCLFIAFITICSVFAISKEDKNFAKKVFKEAKKVHPLHTKMDLPGPNDWLTHHEEEGQTFVEYLRESPVRPTKSRNVIYILPIGDMNARTKKLMTQTSDYVKTFYNLKVKLLDPISTDLIPEDARREGNFYGTQFLTTHILYQVLFPRLPKDGVCMIGLSEYDLWPGKGWNFVFGQANLRKRVGVWSLKRFGVDNKHVSYDKILKRTIKTAVHEIGHMFTMRHCIRYQCVMNGSNSMEESDSRPLYACPHCLCKFLYLTQKDMKTHFNSLEHWCRFNKLTETADFYKKSLEALEGKIEESTAETSQEKSE